MGNNKLDENVEYKMQPSKIEFYNLDRPLKQAFI